MFNREIKHKSVRKNVLNNGFLILLEFVTLKKTLADISSQSNIRKNGYARQVPKKHPEKVILQYFFWRFFVVIF